MSLPIPNTSRAAGAQGVGMNTPFEMSAKDQEMWDAPLISLAQRSGGDLRLLLYSLFSFLNRKTDFYMVPKDKPAAGVDGRPVRKMGFQEGEAEKLLLAAFRQFPLRRVSYPNQNSNVNSDSSSNSNSSSGSKPNSAAADKHRRPNTCKPSTVDSVSTAAPAAASQPSSADDKIDGTEDNIIDKRKKATNENQSELRYSEDNKQIPVGNGGSSPKHGYQWTQTIHETSIAFPLPESTRAKDLNVLIKSSSLSVSFKRQTPDSRPQLLEGTFSETIRTDESTWIIEGGVLLVTLDKMHKTWWETVFRGHEPIDTDLVDSKRLISEYDDATQGMIRKILFDQRQERLGLPQSEELLRQSSEGTDTNANGKGNDAGAVKLLGTDRESMPKLPPGVEYIDKSNFPPNK